MAAQGHLLVCSDLEHGSHLCKLPTQSTATFNISNFTAVEHYLVFLLE